jgi:hypothetical protein
MNDKGWIALDIDGTITLDKYSVPEPVIQYLRELSLSGWRIALATGRAFCFASLALEKFDFPFILLPQNGSVALEMPAKKALFKSYIAARLLGAVEQAFQGFDSDFVVYAGYDRGDRCYWRPHRLSPEDLQYLEDLQKREKETWEVVDRFDPAKIADFPLIKCFGHPHRMKILAERLRSTGLFQVSQIRDVFHENYYILLVTDIGTSKGASLKKVFQILGRGPQVIAAGDDENDISLLEVADVKIAMSHAPETLQEIADFIAPPTKEHGIIRALQMVLSQ